MSVQANCEDEKVEDEEHVFLECEGFKEERAEFFNDICKIIPNFLNADKDEQLRIIFLDSLEIPLKTKDFVMKISKKVNKSFTEE